MRKLAMCAGLLLAAVLSLRGAVQGQEPAQAVPTAEIGVSETAPHQGAGLGQNTALAADHIQIGPFTSLAEAERQKAKLEGKGYRAYILEYSGPPTVYYVRGH